MFTSSHHRRRGTRRGVVLILVLGMLGLMALIGVMFATYSGQAEISARNYALAQAAPDQARLMDYALSQLIDDTDNPLSAIRGHSLRADMYGNDASNNGYLASRPDGLSKPPIPDAQFYVTLSQVDSTSPGPPRRGLTMLRTNIPAGDSAFSSYNFTRWIVHVFNVTGPPSVSQTLEIVVDDPSDSDPFANGMRVFWVIAPDETTRLIKPTTSPPTSVGLVRLPVMGDTPVRPVRFVLDGRYLRAFNGSGMGTNARFPNYRINGDLSRAGTLTQPYVPGDPTTVGMDEDYDACDLENWFLGIQSADGQVIIPSFHRPGILRHVSATNNDWVNPSANSAARILRPREADGHSDLSFPNLVPDASGKITYDVDNDGDGVNDAVWLDLGYPATRDASGRLTKPLFAFTVIGLNGRIPLNTAGNIQLRRDRVGAGGEPIGDPLFSHATHLGNSPSEIDVSYVLQNEPGSAQADNAGVGVRLTQLRALLTGTRMPGPSSITGDTNTVPSATGPATSMPNGLLDSGAGETSGNRFTEAVEGRYGEGSAVSQVVTGVFNNPVRAGLSQSTNYSDARDDNLNAFDYFGAPTAESADRYDLAGALVLPVERIRRFVTPIDLSGNGRVTTWSTTNPLGADQWGRVSFFQYFRPPGVPMVWNTFSNDPENTPDNPPYTAPMRTPGTVLLAPTTAKDNSNNQYHGYESFRYPNVVAPLNRFLAAGMPFNVGTGAAPQTFNANVNSLPRPLLGLDEPDEMNLYTPSNVDAPFGPGDLEWLYRKHDVDGTSLDSRLAHLAPVSFTNPVDGLRRRRMVSIDTWEMNNFVWAYDNPSGDFANNSAFGVDATTKLPNPTGFPLADPAGAVFPRLQTPSLAHRNRKINLNFPLPVSNDPNEPVRQKWIRETYQMLKAILPPRAVDHPEELRQLSQFVVNIVDFRDPDATMTRFVNTDLVVTQASPSGPPTLDRANATPLAANEYQLIQHGMEYSPIAINEVLAYQFKRKANAPTGGVGPVETPRLFVELVNTLTLEGAPTAPEASNLNLIGWDLVIMNDDPLGRPDPFTGQIPVQPSPASIREIELGTTVIPALNPDPTQDATGNAGYFYVLGNTAPAQALPPGSTVTPPAETNPPTSTALAGLNLTGPTPVPADPPEDPPKLASELEAGRYYWLYLRRPVNPLDPKTYNDNEPNDKRIVVDSFRFMFNSSLGMVTGVDPATGNGTVVPGADFLTSLQRLQPHRGGHAVPKEFAPPPPGSATTAPPAGSQLTAYGYSEQMVPAPAYVAPTAGPGVPPPPTNPPSAIVGNYGDRPITGDIWHTLGKANTLTYDATKPARDDWDYLPFHDRDFTSVAELLLVPGCPPGLFTKVFNEAAPPIPQSALNVIPPPAGTNPYPAPVVPAPPPPPPPPPGTLPTGYAPMAKVFAAEPPPASPPHTFPYLVDKFFYTGANPADATPVDGGTSAAGWFRMMEFLEVPSPMQGAIGAVQQGQNFDWFRQDVKPGLLNLNLIIDEEVFFGLMGTNIPLNTTRITDATLVPKVVTQVNAAGAPTGFYYMSNRGYYDGTGFQLKAAFGDFLKLRHGGSGNLFAFGDGVVGQPNAEERPFRALSYPDINFTIFRPATLPPSASSTPVENTAAATGYVGNPGLKNPFIVDATNPVQPPPIPARRLFQVPDNYGSTAGFVGTPSNASTSGDPYVNGQTTNTNLTNSNADLTTVPTATSSTYLGGTSATDRRQHPYFRTEWLQKVSNLTTVRTHQYAVWITVGFFEVTRPGNPQLAYSSPSLALDLLGEEVGLRAGRNVRHRSFFIVDRTKLTGRIPSAQDSFANAVLYRSRIQ